MISAMALSLAPAVSLLLRARLPSMVAGAGLLMLLSAYTIFLWSWIIPVAAIFAAAIAGPPSEPPRGVEPADSGGCLIPD